MILGFVHGVFAGCGSTAGTIEFMFSSCSRENQERHEMRYSGAAWLAGE